MKTFFKDVHIYAPFILVCILFCVAFFVGYTSFADISDRLVLHQDVQGNIDLTGARKELFFAVAAMCAVSFLNVLLAKAAYPRERLLSYIFSYATIAVAFGALLYVVSVASMN